MTACSFTGHRSIEARHTKGIRSLVMRAVDYAYGEGCRDFYNGGAIGFDLLAASVVLEYRKAHPDVRLHILVPCRGQDARWSQADKREYARILDSADSVTVMAEHYYDGCMHVRNRRLVDNCDMLIAYLGRNTGGTAATVRMANAAKKKVYNLYPALDKEN